MNNIPVGPTGFVEEELNEAEKWLKWGELDEDGKARQRGFIEGLQLALSMIGDIRHLSGVVEGMVRALELASRSAGPKLKKR